MDRIKPDIGHLVKIRRDAPRHMVPGSIISDIFYVVVGKLGTHVNIYSPQGDRHLVKRTYLEVLSESR